MGAISLEGQFAYRHQREYFNTQSYGTFLGDVLLPKFYRRGHRVFLIQDNASYHTHPDLLAWYAKESACLLVSFLPKYSPEFNPMERIWHYSRKEGTHNHYFPTVAALCDTLFTVFANIQQFPGLVQGFLTPFI